MHNGIIFITILVALMGACADSPADGETFVLTGYRSSGSTTPPGMPVSVLLAKDPSVYSNLQRKYQGVIGTFKKESN
jgi:hypothetical protein